MKSQGKFQKNLIGAAVIAALFLLIPLIAMLISNEASWGIFDFAAAWVLVFSAVLIYKLISQQSGNTMYKAATAVGAGTGLFLIWANLAVGLIGSEDNSANIMYLGVLAVAVLGILIARFQPQKMAMAMFATAAAQMIVAVIALIAGMHNLPGSSVAEIIGINGFFAVLWSASALLFLNAAQKNQAAS